MKNELESKFLLQVFDKIRQSGEKKDDKYLLNGIVAFTDHDGYTLFIEDAKVKLQFGFHNQYHFDYPSQDAYDQFEKKLKEIDKQY
ncbi:MAG: hypothetical protein CL587_16390 [Alteromonadaceae bacterium]|uniref:DUF3081 domain-containing protein n=1 Tax=unclassified Alteromonas TaxID=2614992 RepID=UPI000C59892B|nr:DUF3081 domain-containing protein [Alteromonas sp. 1_MG-2023]MBT81958.1 hypothetical protein [Alteromonadaceae bacterium]MDO6474892.1 DUF3081 domain-containing protein [Alteromonas sp. 1_MG-2023]